MGAVPTAPTFAPGVATSAQMNQVRDAIAFLQQPPMCYGVHALAQNVANNNPSWDLIALTDELYDNRQSGDAEQHSISTDPSRLYIRTPGIYLVAAQITFASNATGSRSIQVRKNSAGSITGGSTVATNKQQAVSGVSTSATTPVVEVPFVAGDYIEMFCSQTSGVTLATLTGADASFLRHRWVSR